MTTKAKHTAVLVLSWIFMGAAATAALANHADRVAMSADAPAH